MGALSIRGVDEQLSTMLKQQAKATKKSVNQFVLETLRKHVGLEKNNVLPVNMMNWTAFLANGQ